MWRNSVHWTMVLVAEVIAGRKVQSLFKWNVFVKLLENRPDLRISRDCLREWGSSLQSLSSTGTAMGCLPQGRCGIFLTISTFFFIETTFTWTSLLRDFKYKFWTMWILWLSSSWHRTPVVQPVVYSVYPIPAEQLTRQVGKNCSCMQSNRCVHRYAVWNNLMQTIVSSPLQGTGLLI